MRRSVFIRVFVCGITAFTTSAAFAQVGIGTTAPHASAKLEIAASDKGFLPPRVTLTGTDDATTISTPATGLLVYNTATAGSAGKEVTPGLYTWNGTLWERLSANNPNGQDIGYIVGWGSATTPPDYLLPLSGGTFDWADYPDFQTLHADYASEFIASSTATSFTLVNLNTDGRFLRGSATPGVNQAMATAAPTTTAFATATAGAHTHSVDPVAVTSTSGGSHTHTVDPAAVSSGYAGDHAHTTDPAGFSSGGAGGHNHIYYDAYFAENSVGSVGGNGQYGTSANTDWDNSFRFRTSAGSNSYYPSDIYTSWVGDHTHWIDVPSTWSSTNGNHNHSVDVASTTSSTDGAHTHSVDVASTTSSSDGNHTHTITGGDTETRPINTSVVWCLKVKSTSTSGAISIYSGATSAANGLTLNNNSVELGGTLSKATTIQSGGNALILGGSAQLGVGKTPSQAVDVNGNIAATGNITAGGNATVTGNISATGSIRSAAPGSILNMVVLNETELGTTSGTSISSNTETTVATYTYTPVSNSSTILVEFDGHYGVSGNTGSGDDEFRCQVKIGGTSVQSKWQTWRSGGAADTRSGTLFPIMGKASNSGTTGVAIAVVISRTTGDDTVTVNGDMVLKITEIAR